MLCCNYCVAAYCEALIEDELWGLGRLLSRPEAYCWADAWTVARLLTWLLSRKDGWVCNCCWAEAYLLSLSEGGSRQEGGLALALVRNDSTVSYWEFLVMICSKSWRRELDSIEDFFAVSIYRYE